MYQNRRHFTFVTIILACAVATAWAVAQDAAELELAELQSDLKNLEAELATLEATGKSLPAEYAERVQNLRDQAIYLRVKMQKHHESGGEGSGVTTNEVRELRNDIAALRTDVRSLRRDRVEGTITLPVGTQISVQLLDSLGSATSSPGDTFTATAAEPVSHTGEIVIPAGTVFEGVVEAVDRAEGRTDRKASLTLAFNQLEMDGRQYDITATVTGASEKMETGIADETTRIGVGAGIGTVLGAVFGGKKGALVGAVIGGAGTILATEGKEVELPRGTVLDLRLDRELTASVPTT